MDTTALQTLWFILLTVLFLGYFVLEGFDFGVGMNVAAIGKGDDTRTRQVLRTIAPVWDGNQVWLIVAGGAMFAAFPEMYATLFSGFYLALLLILVALIVRVCAFKYRDKIDNPTWHRTWDIMHVIGGLLPALLWGVAFANIVQGVGIDENRWITTSLLGLLNPFGLLGGLVFVLLFWLHGTLYLALRTTGEVRERAHSLAGKLIIPTIVGGAIFLIWAQLAYSRSVLTWLPLLVAALALVAVIPLNRARKEGLAFAASSLAIAAATIQLFGGLFPYLLPARGDDALSLTVANASSSEHTLMVMTIATVILLPIVLAYQVWTYWVFRRRVTEDEVETPAGGMWAMVRSRYREAFDQG
ncbi:cytochrome d ubiquinol oxidase subunit II [Brachybacterium sp. EF45031]|uniref:cytochrome d ubiquinol oxidase subunit II n=1 Tax=Brachybacterium sillae TaxID=2810536 RepID=UPI00217E7920|nr:cytochrome d ubiquinol oxidase subunit II [Brachybacterium sillae]MCS6710835.1 cytochrome d ubiquinol oxidase subunit II [Brachybacterium sillae]